MKKGKRLISKSKTYGFNPWVDQIDAISQILAETGEKAESVVLRKLIDEALSARRKKTSQTGLELQPGQTETLHTLETLLVKLVRQGEQGLRINDVSLALLQDTLAEARAGRNASWQLRTTELTEKGVRAAAIAKQFDEETAAAKNYAYALAESIKKSQEPGKDS